MGIFKALFGRNKSTFADSDGLWLKSERNSTWKEVATMHKTHALEVSVESCCESQVGTFGVLRSFDEKSNTMMYMGCLIPAGHDDVMLLAVDRLETKSGEVKREDDWTKDRGLDPSKVSNIAGAVATIRNFACFNNYSTLPFYALAITMKMNE